MGVNAIRTVMTAAEFASEAVAYGTEGASYTQALSLLEGDISEELEQAARQDLYQGAGGLVPGGYIDGRNIAKARTRNYVTYKGIGLLWSAIMGSVATQNNTPSAGLYTHTWTIAKDPSSLSVRLHEGDALGGTLVTQKRELLGALVDSVEISVEAHQNMEMAIDWMGQDATAPADSAGVTLTNSSYNLVHGAHAGTLSWNSVTYTLRSFRLRFKRAPLFRDRLGSGLTDRPYSVNLFEVEMEVTLDKVSQAFIAAQVAKTESDAVITFTDPATGTHTLAFTLQNARVKSATSPKSGFNLLQETVTFIPRATSSATGLKVVAVNNQSSAVAA